MKERKKFFPIKIKLLGIILPVVLVIIVVLIGLSYFVSERVLKQNAHSLLNSSVESQASEIEGWLDKNLNSVNAVKQGLEEMDFGEKETQDFLYAYYNFDSNFPEGFQLASTKGKIYKSEEGKAIGFREPDATGNFLENGDFSVREDLSDKKGWTFLTALGGEASAQIEDKEIKIFTVNEGGEDYSVQLVQPELFLQKNTGYRVSFDACADGERNMKVSVTAPDQDYKRYLEDTEVLLTTQKQTFTYEFTMGEEDDANGRLEFNLGAAGSKEGVTISNVSVSSNAPFAPGEEKENAQDSQVTRSEWFLKGQTRVNMGFTDAYINDEGKQVISVCGMLNKNTEDVWVLSGDLSLERISIFVSSFVKMEDAQSLLVDAEEGRVLASRDTALISAKLGDSSDEFMKNVAEKIASYQYDLVEMNGNICVFEPVEGTNWLLVSYVPAKTVYKDLRHTRNIMILFGIVSVLVLTLLMERIVHIVIMPVKKLTDLITTMTEGDFTIQSDEGSNDEIGIMSRCVNVFIEAMRGVIVSIDHVSHMLHNQADSSKDVSVQMFSASKQQNQSMKDMNSTVNQLSRSVNVIAQSATTLAALVEETKADGDGVSGKMEETVNISQKGKAVMQDVDAAMHSINDSVRQLQSAIDEVGQASQEITDITRTIGEIADETNLLSLNASIEAARAGEAGKGFAVVASETSKLAQTSMESVRHIDELIMEIKSLIESVISQAKDSVDNINNSSVLIGNAVKTYDSIFDNIADVSELVEKMIQKINQVENVARNVADISEEQADSSRSILASSDNLVAQADSLMQNSETVAKESENLTTSAKELENQIKIFRV